MLNDEPYAFRVNQVLKHLRTEKINKLMKVWSNLLESVKKNVKRVVQQYLSLQTTM